MKSRPIVAAVIRDTRLTHGGLYKHFASKDDLLVKSLKGAFQEIEETLVRAAEHAPRGGVGSNCEDLSKCG